LRAPFIIFDPPFFVFAKVFDSSFLKKPHAAQKAGKKDAKEHHSSSNW